MTGGFMNRHKLLALAVALWASAIVSGSVFAQSSPIGSFDGASSPTADLWGKKIERIQFQGNRKVEDDAIRVNLATKANQPLDASRLRSDIRAMWKMGFFRDVKVEGELTKTGGVILTFSLAEKASIRKVLISGNDEMELDKINEVLDLKRDTIVNVTKIKKNRDKIRDLYIEKGYYLASVDYETRKANEAEVDVWYLIDENSKVEIRDVSFIGNKSIPDSELRGIIGTRKGGALSFLSDGGIYQEETFERDLLIITAHYYDRGHINVKLGTPQIRLSRDKRYMYLSIPIDEGPVFQIGEVKFKGKMDDKESAFFKKLSIKAGETFNRSRVGTDIQRLTNFYKDKGFAYVNVTPLTSIDLEKRKVALTFEVQRGNKVYFERINIRGNAKTRDKVIRREMKISEGELYNQTALDVSQRRINALGFFENVNISTKRGSSDEFIEVNVEVSERPTGTFQIGAGFSSVENFIAQAQISQNNLFGRGQTLTLQAQVSGLRQLFLLRFAEPYLLDTRWTFAFDVYNQSRAFAGFARNAVGGNLTWGYPLSWESRVFLTYKLEDVGITTGGTSLTSFGGVTEALEGTNVYNLFRGGITSSLRASISYDSRNNRLFPTDGWNMNGFVEVADSFIGSGNVFTRYGGFIRHYRPLWGPFVLKMNGELGFTTSRTSQGVPITERYLIGGIFDIRGFRPRSLGPRLAVPGDKPDETLRFLPLGGNMQIITNTEIEFALFKRVGISGVVFFDAGNAYNLEPRYCNNQSGAGNVSIKFNPCFEFPNSLISGIRTSVGFGFRWFSPIGPLRFEWGVPLDRQEGEEPLVFEFTIGNFF